jgi:hypothetical protein
MKKLTLRWSSCIVLIASTLMMLTGCASDRGGGSAANQATVDSLRLALKAMSEGNATLEKNLNNFDTLDYVAFSKQEWARFHESHSNDIVVNWPDGHQTKGLDKHIEDLKGMFTYAPDTRITMHPIRFGNSTGEWTCVTGVMEGTFSKPMHTPDGKVIQPTNKAFKVNMCTIGHWKDGLMIEESLFWDNQTFMRQMGLGK